MMAASISVPLLGIVDTAILGHLDSPAYLAAVNVGSSAMNLLIWGFGFLRMSTVGLVAQADGANNKILRSEHLIRALTVALALGMLVVSTQRLWLPWLMALLADGSSSVALAQDYLDIRLWSVPFHLLLFVINGYFLAVGRVSRVLYLTLVGQLVNMLLNYLLVMVYHLDVRGVAWGSLISQCLAASMGIYWLLKERHLNLTQWVNVTSWWQRAHLWALFHLNKNVFIRTLCLMTVFALMTRFSAQQGTLTLAVNALLLNFFYLTSYALDGYAHAIESISGRLFGQRDWQALKMATTSVVKISWLVAVAISLLFWLSGEFIVNLLTDLHAVRRSAYDYLVWCYLLPIIAMLGFVYDGLCVGITASKVMRDAMLIATFLVFIPAWYGSGWLLPQANLENHRLWAAFSLFFLARGLLMRSMYRRHYLGYDPSYRATGFTK